MAFPSLESMPLMGAAVKEIHKNVKAPQSLVFSSVLSALSLVLQGLFDVRKPIGGSSVPVSMYLLVVAESGERKTAVEDVVFKAVKAFQKKRQNEYCEKLSRWEALNKARETERKVVLKRLSKNFENGISGGAERAWLIQYELERPKKPRRFKMLYEDSTPEALFAGLYRDLPTAGLIASEGGSVLNGRALGDVKKLSSIWSGSESNIDRVTTESFVLDDVRLTISIMTQETELNLFKKRRGDQARGSGFWARFLVCQPESTQGTRFIQNTSLSWGHVDRFSKRILGFLNDNECLLNEVAATRTVISFSNEAAERWIEFTNKVESMIGAHGLFEGAGDHASKLADNVARLAALIHCFEGFEGDISVDVVSLSIDVCSWYSRHFIKLFNSRPQVEVDADELVEWLKKYEIKHGRFVTKNHVRQFGPNCIRNKTRLDSALELIHSRGVIGFQSLGRSLGIDLTPWQGGSIQDYTSGPFSRANGLGF